MCDKEYCDFIVWTNEDFHLERVGVDSELCNEIIIKSTNFFLKAVLPELVGKFFSRVPLQLMSSSSQEPNSTNAAELICICQVPYDASTDNVVSCDNENCSYKWLHYKCIKIKRAPRKATWLCPECKKLDKRKKKSK